MDPSGPGVGVGKPLGPGIQDGTLQHCGSLGSATRMQVCGRLSYLRHLELIIIKIIVYLRICSTFTHNVIAKFLASNDKRWRPVLASVKASAGILTPTDPITAIIPLLSLGICTAIHGANV